MTITGKQVIDTVRQIAAERPEFKYTDQDQKNAFEAGCSYRGMSAVHPTEGEGCIVGQALSRLGVSVTDLEKIEMKSAEEALDALEIFSTGTQRRFLTYVQEAQDTGCSWGDAVKDTEETFKDVAEYLEVG